MRYNFEVAAMVLSLTEKIRLKMERARAKIAEREYTIQEIKRVIRSDANKETEARTWLYQGLHRFCPAPFKYDIYRNKVTSALVAELRALENNLFDEGQFEPDDLGLEHYERGPQEENGSRTKFTYFNDEHLEIPVVKSFSAIAHGLLRARIAEMSEQCSPVRGRFGRSLLELFDMTTESEKPLHGFMSYYLPNEMYGIASHADTVAVWGISVILLRDGGSIKNGLHIENTEEEIVDVEQAVGDIALFNNTTIHNVPVFKRSERRSYLILWF